MTITINLPDTVQYYIEQKIIDEKKVADMVSNYLKSLSKSKNEDIKITVEPVLWSEEVLSSDDHKNFVNILKAA